MGPLVCFFEVLVVFGGGPGAAPGEAVGCEELVGQVCFIDFVREVGAAIYVWFAVGWFDAEGAVHGFNVWIVQRVDVDS